MCFSLSSYLGGGRTEYKSVSFILFCGRHSCVSIVRVKGAARMCYFKDSFYLVQENVCVLALLVFFALWVQVEKLCDFDMIVWSEFC